jgi:hypothetical protein
MELTRTRKAEEVVFGKGFVPVVAAFFSGTADEIERFCDLIKESGDGLHVVIDPNGTVTYKVDGKIKE